MRLREVAPTAGLMLVACGDIPGTSAHAIRRAEQATAAVMTNPGSAEFRSVSIGGPTALEVACGEVRGKDRTGSYGPFDRFVTLIDGGAPMIDQDGSGRVTSSAAVADAVFAAAWDQECATSEIPTYQQDETTNMLDPSVGPSLNEAEEAANIADDANQ